MKKSKNPQSEYIKTSHCNLRIIIIICLFAAALILFLSRLMVLQIAKNDYYESLAIPKNYKNAIIETSRGNILDTNGKVLVSNAKSPSIRINRSYLDTAKTNEVLLKFLEICQKNGVQVKDYLPVSENYPYTLNKEYIFDSKATRALTKFLNNNEINENLVYSEGLYKLLCERYGIDSINAKKNIYRKLVGIRYDMETSDFSNTFPYTLITDVPENLLFEISENIHLLHGIEISYADSRYYNFDNLACHILGKTGPLSSDEVEEYVNQKGYSYNALIGKDGIEKAFEEHLRSVNGTVQLEIDAENNIVGKQIINEPKYGENVYLSIDAGMQSAAQKALENEISEARQYGIQVGGKNSGADCRAGSVVVMNVNTGEILACASYPDYNLNTFSQDFNQLNSDSESRPLVNRSTQGIYPPGSTFKIATALAALNSDIVDTDTIVYDKGVYEKYDTYQPHCWIFDSKGYTHGYVNLKSAIRESCNYYFYEIADKLGIDAISQYASNLGLGKETGVEIPESTGILANPEYRHAVGLAWNPGDTLQASIGQSDNAFTPLQICSYMSTVINGGTRYKATLLKAFGTFENGKEKFVYNQPQILDKIDIDKDDLQVIKSAMRQVVAEGTARNVFENYKYDIGGKTGTAQVSKGSDTSLFVGFAPYDNPEIVVSVVVENGANSSRSSNVAKTVFDYYFENIN